MDWIKFFDSNHIHYVEHGPNVSRGHVCIHCVWCGAADSSQHLSVNLAGKGFRCWKQPRVHSGKNPAKLIQALLNCSWEQAERLAGNQKSLPNDFLTKLKATFFKPEAAAREKLVLPKEFKQFTAGLPSSRPFVNYLKDRGFADRDIALTKGYGIYYATQGLYSGRIIFTVTQYSELVGWTGRTIGNSVVRYSTLTDDAEKAKERGEIPAPHPISNYLLFYDRVVTSGAHTIVLCEGPFDAWRVNLLGSTIGVTATCFFTSMLSDQQINLLHELLPKFERRVLLLDQNTFSKAERIRNELRSLGVEAVRLPKQWKDPAEMWQVRHLQNVLAIV